MWELWVRGIIWYLKLSCFRALENKYTNSAELSFTFSQFRATELCSVCSCQSSHEHLALPTRVTMWHIWEQIKCTSTVTNTVNANMRVTWVHLSRWETLIIWEKSSSGTWLFPFDYFINLVNETKLLNQNGLCQNTVIILLVD